MNRVKRAALVVLSILLIVISISAARTARELIEQGDALWLHRDGTISETRQSIELFKQAIALEPNSFEANWKAARACYWVGDRSEDPAVDKQYGQMGMEFAAKALEIDDRSIEGHYYMALCAGQYGDGISMIQALAQGIGGKFMDHMEICYRMNPLFDYGGPCIALGRYYQVVPWPLKDLDKAVEMYKQALAAFPWVYRARLYLAETYMELDEVDEAKAILSENVACPEGNVDSWECEYYKGQAARYLREILAK